MSVELFDNGQVQVAATFAELLRANALDSFEAVMARPGGTVVRDFPGRRTTRLDLKSPDGGIQTVYLKRYESGYLSIGRKIKRWLHWPGADDEALREWRSIQRVLSLGLNTATPIAIGQRHGGGFVSRSFLMTAEIAGAVEGHIFAAKLDPSERRQFLRRVAELARRFHQAGFVHKDFYLGHVLVAPDSNKPALFLIDLQRAVQPCCLRERWLAKDLGALAYSTLRAGASATDLLRGYKTYCGLPSWGQPEKRMARRVAGRVAWLSTRRPKHDGDFDPSV